MLFKDAAQKHWNEAEEIYLKNKVEERKALIIEMSGDNYFDGNCLEEAIDAYSGCLMLVQEEENLQKEAKVYFNFSLNSFQILLISFHFKLKF